MLCLCTEEARNHFPVCLRNAIIYKSISTHPQHVESSQIDGGGGLDYSFIYGLLAPFASEKDPCIASAAEFVKRNDNFRPTSSQG